MKLLRKWFFNLFNRVLKILKTFPYTFLKAKRSVSLIVLLFCSAYVSAQLKADFNATPVSGCAPLVALFNDASTGSPTSWHWDLGNGATSTLQTPAAVYSDPGTYTVKLVIQNAVGIDSVTKVQYITVYASPVVNFSGSPLTGCFPLNSQFTDQTNPGSGSVTKWEWDFGDGNISTAQNPNHTYTRVGNFNIALKATNSFGCFSFKSSPSYVQISSGAKADFSSSSSNSCKAPATIDFVNNSVGTGSLNYQWDFGDGSTSTSVSPSHTYTAAGSYSVSLIVFNSIGCTDTLIKSNFVTVGNTKADFDSVSICKGVPTTLKNTSTPAPGGAFWDFGDGTFSDSVNPTKTYSDTGTFMVKMVANFGACKDSVSKAISVLGTPVVNFSSSAKSACQAPFEVNFTDSSSAGTGYLWDFGDGSTSTSQNPSHTYTSTGNFTVKLFVTNAAGCMDSIVKTGLIVVKAPVVTIKGLPFGSCPPLTHTFSTQVTSVDSIATYLWDFGDGTTSDSSAPTHTFTTPGNYTISLTYTTTGGCSGVVKVDNGIAIGSRPKANFSAAPLETCASQFLRFTDLSTGNPNSWIWLFGDGTSSTEQNPIHLYNDTGRFTVKLTALNNGCSDTISFTNYVHIRPPVSQYNASSTCEAPARFVFLDRSIGADSWSWDFGDGSPLSTEQNPTHDYAGPGSYYVSLTVTNASTGCSFQRGHTVKVINEIPVFSISDSVVCKNTPVTFTAVNNTPENIRLYTWNFGDGTTLSDSTGTITYKYTQTGSFNVSLTIRDIKGCNKSVTIPNAVSVSGPTAAFKSSTAGVCINSPAVFTDSSYDDGVHPIQSWNWNWGDGTTQNFSAPPFSHTYSKAGNFNVSLVVTDNLGCVDSLTVPNAVFVSNPKASFSGDSLSCTTSSASLLNASTGQGLTYLWNLGDGTTSAQENPVHLYNTEGLYTISLAVTDKFGCKDSISKADYLKIANPLANFTINDSIASCPPLIANFTNTSLNFLTSEWDFGDGATSSARNPSHFYSTVGSFTAVLTVASSVGCTAQKSMQIRVNGPSTSFSYNDSIGCAPLQTTFSVRSGKGVTLLWDFGDGASLRAPDAVVRHTYTTPGLYIPKLIVADSAGCSVLLKGADTIRAVGVTASFNSSSAVVCDTGNVQFTNTSITNDVITNYAWNFGDGSVSSQQNPLHSYTAPGIYGTTLIVTTRAGCKDTVSNPANIKVVNSPEISISGDAGACVPATLNFSGVVLVPDTSALSWKWDFGNGNSSAVINPPAQNYATAGTYTVKATAMNSSGCQGIATRPIEIYPLPSLIVSPDTTICQGDAAPLSVSGAQSYVWSPATYLSCVSCANPVSQATSTIGYQVTGTSNRGCVAKDSVKIIVKQPFTLTVSNATTICIGSSVQLTASGAENYAWSPASGLSNVSISSPVAIPTATTTYQVVGSDSEGCFADTAFVPITVSPLPVVDAGADQTINVSQQTQINPTVSADVANVLWTPSTGIVSYNNPGVVVKPTITTQYTIEVQNAVGCKASDNVTIFVVCNNANVFVPNTFSPNGDGANDFFYPRGSGVFKIRGLTIFNRWGQIVFQRSNFNANDASAGWDGTYGGRKLPPDVFVYTLEVICENNETLVYKGNISLLR